MQLSKYILALALSAILAEATEHSSVSPGKETSKQAASKASTVVHSHETPKTTLKYDDYSHGYEDKDYDNTKTTHRYHDKDYDRTTTHRYKYEDHDNTKTTHSKTISYMTRL
jgi:hypothetical protein